MLLIVVMVAGCSSQTMLSKRYQRITLTSSSALVVCDWGMTRWMPETNAYDRGYVELNPIVGRNPSTAKVDAIFAIALAAHIATYKIDAIPDWAKSWWYTTVTVVEAANVLYFNPSGVCGDFGAIGG